MWTVIYTAQDKDISNNMCEALRHENILIKVISAENENKFDILVPATEVAMAHEVLIDMRF